jgi:hypothetical protein
MGDSEGLKNNKRDLLCVGDGGGSHIVGEGACGVTSVLGKSVGY